MHPLRIIQLCEELVADSYGSPNKPFCFQTQRLANNNPLRRVATMSPPFRVIHGTRMRVKCGHDRSGRLTKQWGTDRRHPISKTHVLLLLICHVCCSIIIIAPAKIYKSVLSFDSSYCGDNHYIRSCCSGKTYGICGNMNGNERDDYRTNEGENVYEQSNRCSRICNSWRDNNIATDK